MRYIKATTEIEGDDILAIASTPTKDREGDSLKVEDWDLSDYKNNPQLLFSHDHHQTPIGRAKDIWTEDNKLMFKPEFQTITQFGREIKELAKQGFLKSWSVGFLPVWEKGKFVANQLLEISLVNVGCNSEALTVAKSMGYETDALEDYLDHIADDEEIEYDEAITRTKSLREDFEKLSRLILSENDSGKTRVLDSMCEKGYRDMLDKETALADEKYKAQYKSFLEIEGRFDDLDEVYQEEANARDVEKIKSEATEEVRKILNGE